MVLADSEKSSSRSRTTILQAALHLFTARGYDGTSIDDIRLAAGFKSKASLYTHFKSKEELFEAIAEEQCSLQAERVFELDSADHDAV